ncbi:MAG TPA: TIGR00282 family metallophosphoesterase [Candidatus Krumholzibacteriaceae bacterium]|nr:TIGR00282 family metallophosphoesterase [Candidatus Krumholzibacteriaceae bacterium]
MRVLLLGDVLSKIGRNALKIGLPQLKEYYQIDLCVANVENAAGMFGITKKVKNVISNCGVDIMTSGNHIWDKSEGVELLGLDNDILRPANYPEDVPGKGHLITEINGTSVAVINLQGRVFMPAIDCPFRTVDKILRELEDNIKIILVDIHAEATSEKLAMAFYLDGRVSVVVGTHTHVPTADERILRNGTAYQTDLGMSGPFDSVIGMKKKETINRFLKGIKQKFKIGGEIPVIEGLFVDIDNRTGKARKVERILKKIDEKECQ